MTLSTGESFIKACTIRAADIDRILNDDDYLVELVSSQEWFLFHDQHIGHEPLKSVEVGKLQAFWYDTAPLGERFENGTRKMRKELPTIYNVKLIGRDGPFGEIGYFECENTAEKICQKINSIYQTISA